MARSLKKSKPKSRESKLSLKEELEWTRQLRKAIEDPIWWFENWCYTQDVHRPNLARAPFPKYHEARHLYRYIEVLMTENRIVVPKSRQLTWSWTTVAFFLWATQFFRNQMNFLISEKQRKANALIQRAKFVYNHQPCPQEILDLVHIVTYSGRDIGTTSIIPFFPPMTELQKGQQHVQSKLQALSEEADDIRMETATRVFFDEMAYMDKAEEAVQAIEPTLGMTGQLVGVSSPNGKNYFYRQCFDLSEDEVV